MARGGSGPIRNRNSRRSDPYERPKVVSLQLDREESTKLGRDVLADWRLWHVAP